MNPTRLNHGEGHQSILWNCSTFEYVIYTSIWFLQASRLNYAHLPAPASTGIIQWLHTCHVLQSHTQKKTNCSKTNIVKNQAHLHHSSSWPTPAEDGGRSGIVIILTTKLVHPVKCWIRWPWPFSGLYCSQANPVLCHSRKTFCTRFVRSSV